MNNATAGGHPLRPARADHAVVARGIAMLVATFEEVGDGLDARMRVRSHPVAPGFAR
jgi:hypothetical protein